MDKLQVLALCLELTGFALAFLHVYQKDFSDLLHKKISTFMEFSGVNGIDFACPGPEDDMSLSAEARNAIFSRNTVVRIGFSLCMLFVWSTLEQVETLLGAIAAFFYIVIGGFLLNVLIGIIYMIVGQIFYFSIKITGKGDVVAGLGFVLAGLGMCIETYQIWNSSLYWTIFIIWGVFSFIVFMFLFKRKGG